MSNPLKALKKNCTLFLHGGRQLSLDWIHSSCNRFQWRPRGTAKKMVSNCNVDISPETTRSNFLDISWRDEAVWFDIRSRKTALHKCHERFEWICSAWEYYIFQDVTDLKVCLKHQQETFGFSNFRSSQREKSIMAEAESPICPPSLASKDHNPMQPQDRSCFDSEQCFHA